MSDRIQLRKKILLEGSVVKMFQVRSRLFSILKSSVEPLDKRVTRRNLNLNLLFFYFLYNSIDAPIGSRFGGIEIKKSGSKNTMVYSPIVPPQTLPELLERIRDAWKSGALMERDFFSTDNLLRISGGKSIFWIEESPASCRASIHDLDELAKPISINGNIIPGLQYILGWQSSKGNIRADVLISFSMPPEILSFEMVESIFGSGWVDDSRAPFPTDKLYQIPSDRFGNKKIRYSVKTSFLNRILIVEFSSNGKMSSSHFCEESV